MNARPPSPAYPPRYTEARGSDRGCSISVGLFFALFVFGFGYVLWLGLGGTWQWVGLAFAVFLLVSFIYGDISGRRAVRIIPYYDKPLAEADTFLSGQALARNCLHLDRLAEERGLKSISAFGFPDALRGETVVWHEAGSGLPTITGLLEAVAAYPNAVDDAAAVVADLEKIKFAFEAAAPQGIRFAFLVEVGNSTSAHVWEIRKGHV